MKHFIPTVLMVFMTMMGSLPMAMPAQAEMIHKTDTQWKKILTPQQYNVLRKHGTERAFSGKYDHFYKNGVYVCAGCGQKLFSSNAKFDSKTGWPSFYQPIHKNAVGEQKDWSLGGVRTEIHCARCGSHLGHVFNDGPKPTGLRYCMNSVALKFIPAQANAKHRIFNQPV